TVRILHADSSMNRTAMRMSEQISAEDRMIATRAKRIAVTVALSAAMLLPFHASPLLAQDAAPTPSPTQKQTPPPGSAPKAFTVPAHETYSLPNGMKVTLVPYGNIPKVTVSLVVRAGGLNEPREVLGVADIT